MRTRVAGATAALAAEPRPHGAARFSGQDDYGRVDDYRIVYAVYDAERLVLVVRIPHRRDVYRH